MIYIKPVKRARVSDKHIITIRDIASVYTDCGNDKQINDLVIMHVKEQKNANYLVSALDVIKLISKATNGEIVVNIGVKDTVIDYAIKKSRGSKIFQFIKVAFISVIMFVGSATAIMSFHSDAQFPQVFKNFYYIFFNEKVDNPMIIDVPYSIGLAFGMIVFFNHFGFRKMSEDPTPIQVEMSMYESDTTSTMIEILQKEQEQETNVDL